MKNWLITGLLYFLISSLVACNQQETTTPKLEGTKIGNPPIYEASGISIPKPTVILADVIRVVDGDTIKITLDDKQETVRMILVDTPETKHPDKPVQPFGPEASAFTRKELSGKQVGLEFDVQERDQYGRLLAYIWIDEKLYNAMLLEKGLARVSIFPPNTKYVDQFRIIQAQARNNKIGIWSIEDYATDRGFNDKAANQTDKPTSDISGNCTIKGNISSRGDKIYHMPGQQFYDETKPEQMFCTEAEAQAAGFRKSKR